MKEHTLMLLSEVIKGKERFELLEIKELDNNKIKVKNYFTTQIKLYDCNITTLLENKHFKYRLDVPPDASYSQLISSVDEQTRVLIFKSALEVSQSTYDALLDEYTVYMQEELLKNVIDKNVSKYINKCEKCGGSGVLMTDLGIEVICECQHKEFKSKKKSIKEKSVQELNISAKVKEITGSDSLDTKYDTDRTIQEINYSAQSIKFRLSGFKEYDATLHKIIDSIKNGVEINSYLIGAPSGFGQMEFVDECLIELIKQGKKVVPIESLTRLMEVRVNSNTRLLNNMFKGESTGITSKEYTWYDYATADVVFVRIDDLDNKFIETKALYLLLQDRGNKKLPTIVLTNFNIKVYLTEKKLKLNFWDDMLNYNKEKETTNKSKLNYLYACKKYE